jgi:phosphoribosyl-AMP cyclohydrolase
MNAASLARTLETGRVTYWSRSRAELWEKGATSGHVQRLVEMRIDCDRDALLLLVEQTGPACHTNRRSCFHRALRDGAEVTIMDPL